MTHATQVHPGHLSDTRRAVVVDRPVKYTATGRAHKGSRSSIIREARSICPDVANWGATQILFGSRESENTVVIFEQEYTPAAGLL